MRIAQHIGYVTLGGCRAPVWITDGAVTVDCQHTEPCSCNAVAEHDARDLGLVDWEPEVGWFSARVGFHDADYGPAF